MLGGVAIGDAAALVLPTCDEVVAHTLFPVTGSLQQMRLTFGSVGLSLSELSRGSGGVLSRLLWAVGVRRSRAAESELVCLIWLSLGCCVPGWCDVACAVYLAGGVVTTGAIVAI